LVADASNRGELTISFRLNGSVVCGGSTPTACPTMNSSGVATLANVDLAGIPVGDYATGVYASFAGDASDAASSGTGDLYVGPAPTSTMVTSTPQSGATGASVVVSASVMAQSPATVNEGTISFELYRLDSADSSNTGSDTLVSTASGTVDNGSASASLSLAGLDPGPGIAYSLIAVYEDASTPPSFQESHSAGNTAFVTIDQLTPSVSWPTPADIVYGTPLSRAQLDATASFNGTPVLGNFGYTPAAGVVLHTGKSESLSVSFTPTDSATYGATSGTTAITITPAPLTLTAVDQTRVYGAPIPQDCAIAASHFVNNDSVGSLGGSLSCSYGATQTSPVGSYSITPSGQTSTDYSISYAPGTLTIGQAATTVTANYASATYGDAKVTLAASVAAQSPSTATVGEGTLTFSVADGSGTQVAQTTAGVSNGSASATLQVGGLAAGDYFVSAAYSDLASSTTPSTPATQPNFQASQAVKTQLKVRPAPLAVTAQDKSAIYGQPPPAFTVTYQGFVNGDAAPQLGGTLSFSTSPATLSAAGSYSIIPAGQTSSNYRLTFKPGTLTLQPAGTTTAAQNATAAFGQTSVTLSASVTANPPSSATVTEGTVHFSVTDSTGKQVGQGQGTVSSSGVASTSVTLPARLPPGSYNVAASYQDGATPANFADSSATSAILTIGKASTA
jgi:hypothetical protein